MRWVRRRYPARWAATAASLQRLVAMLSDEFVKGRKERALLSHHSGAPVYSMGQEKRMEPMLIGAGPGFPPSHQPSVYNYRPAAQQYGPSHPPFISGQGRQPLTRRDHSDRASAKREHSVSNPEFSFYGRSPCDKPFVPLLLPRYSTHDHEALT